MPTLEEDLTTYARLRDQVLRLREAGTSVEDASEQTGVREHFIGLSARHRAPTAP